MKKPGGEVALLTPDADGWRLVHAGKTHSSPTLEGALNGLPAKTPIHLALPGPMALMERLTLPSTDREELTGMVQLQLEKTLPYPVEEVTSDFEILSSDESESTVLLSAVHIPGLETLCAPMRARQRLPEKISIFAQHVAAACPPDETALAVWAEQGHLAVAICERGKLSWVQTLPGTDAETLGDDLSRALLSAEMEGVPVTFTRVLLGGDRADLATILRETFDAPLELLPLDGALPEPATNLVPLPWTAEVRKFESTERVRQRLTWVAMGYLVLVALAFLYLAWTKRQVQKVDREIAQMQPQVQAIGEMQQRWRALRPAIDPKLFAVEILYLVRSSLPSEEVLMTVFDYSQTNDGNWQFTIEGEAPTAALAVEFTDKLQKSADLQDFRVEKSRDKFLPDGRVQFTIVGKLL